MQPPSYFNRAGTVGKNISRQLQAVTVRNTSRISLGHRWFVLINDPPLSRLILRTRLLCAAFVLAASDQRLFVGNF